MTQQKDKSGLATMLFALGGALRGDKDFVQKAIQLREMKESKEKKNQQEEAWKTWKENNMNDFLSNTNIPESFKQLFDIMDAKQGLSLVTSFLPKTLSTAQRVSEIAAKVANDPNYKLTKQDELILQISRKADPLTRGIEDISAESLRLQGMQQTQPGSIKTITTQAEYDALEDGEEYITNGIRYKKGE